jgi:hypothetical protein
MFTTLKTKEDLSLRDNKRCKQLLPKEHNSLAQSIDHRTKPIKIYKFLARTTSALVMFLTLKTSVTLSKTPIPQEIIELRIDPDIK